MKIALSLRNGLWSLGLIAALVAPGGCGRSRSAVTNFQTAPWPLRNHTGVIIETDHYRIYTTTRDKELHTAAVTLAEGQFHRFTQSLLIRPREKMTVYIFADVQQWLAFTQAEFGDQAPAYTRIRNGGYTANQFAAFYYLGRYATLTILAHELFHLYVNLAACPDPVPAWMNEGMACYFEAHEWDGFNVVFTPDKNLFRRENLTDALCRKKLFPLKELLSTHAGQVGQLSHSRVLTYYAQLWALMQYLHDPRAGEYHANFQLLLRELGTRNMALKARGYLTTVRADEQVGFGEAVFRQYITADLEKFERDFRDYLPDLIGLK